MSVVYKKGDKVFLLPEFKEEIPNGSRQNDGDKLFALKNKTILTISFVSTHGNLVDFRKKDNHHAFLSENSTGLWGNIPVKYISKHKLLVLLLNED